MDRHFIKNSVAQMNYEDYFYNPAVKFRRTFTYTGKDTAILTVCAVGYGYFYLNGKPVSGDLLCTPVSDYSKTLWTSSYDVTALLNRGENVLCAHLGNGYFNEGIKTTVWQTNSAHWRDVPQFCMELKAGENVILEADTGFKTVLDQATYYNQLRIGEWYDAGKDDNWLELGYDDSAWDNAVESLEHPPMGQFRPTPAPAVRAMKVYPCQKLCKNSKGWVADFGQNFSGYVQIRLQEPKGTVVVLEHSENIDEENELKLNQLDKFYKPFQYDKITCSGEEFVWKPKFTYHGFRYVQISGLSAEPSPDSVQGIFIHQDVPRISEFTCGNALVNQIYQAGIMSVYSNMHYALTDCPTREKLGWMNDAAASAEQLYYNFEMKPFMDKWSQDMLDAMMDNGCTYGTVPQYNWGSDMGPVTDAAYYRVPYLQYLHYGDPEIIRKMLPSCRKNLAYLIRQYENHGECLMNLGDWTGYGNRPTPVDMVHSLLLVEFIDMVQLMAGVIGETVADDLLTCREKLRNHVLETYVRDGVSTVREQTAISMLIFHDLGDMEKLGAQLRDVTLNDNKNGILVGMVGIQFVFEAMARTGNQDLIVDAISNLEVPSYGRWFADGATTLYETFEDYWSKNHHMFSAILAWMIKYVLGVRINQDRTVTFAPLKHKQIPWVKGKIRLLGQWYEIEVRDGVMKRTLLEEV